MESAERPLQLDDPKLYRPRHPERSSFYTVFKGIARTLGGAEWVDLAKTHLLTDGE